MSVCLFVCNRKSRISRVVGDLVCSTVPPPSLAGFSVFFRSPFQYLVSSSIPLTEFNVFVHICSSVPNLSGFDNYRTSNHASEASKYKLKNFKGLLKF